VSPAGARRLDRRQLYMLPTRMGLVFTATLLAMLLAAVNYSNSLAYIFTFLLGAMALVSMLYTHRNVSGLSVSAVADEPVFAGQPLHFRVCLHNSSDYPRTGVRLFVDNEQVGSIDIAPRSSACAQVSTDTLRRGPVSLPDIVVASDYPLGLLFTWSRPQQLEENGLAWPRPLGRLPFHLSLDRRRYQDAGVQPEGDDFRGLRPFRHGDAPQHIHWKAAARGGDLLTKEFGGAGQDTIWLDWDALAGLDTEARLSQLCRWAVDADRGGLNYGLRLPGARLAPANGPVHRRQCLNHLARF